MELTQEYISSIVTDKELRIRLTSNLVLKVTKYKDFYLGTTGKLQKKLGRFPKMSLEEALFISSRNIKTLSKIYSLYKESKPNLAKRTKQGNDNLFSYLEPLHKKDIDKITRSEVISLLKVPYVQGKYEIVKRTYALMKAIYNYALIYEYITTPNPFNIPITSIFRFTESLGFSWIDTIEDLKLLIEYILDYPKGRVGDKLTLNLFLALRASNISSLTSKNLVNNSLYFHSKDMKSNEEFYLGITNELYEYISNIDFIIHPESINKALRDFSPNNLKGEYRFTNHSFRKVLATFSRNYGKFPVDYIDSTLAHCVGTRVTRAYMKSNDIDITKDVISWWQEFLFSLNPNLRDRIII